MSEILYVTGKGHTVTLKGKHKLNDIIYLENEKYKVVGIESYGDSLQKTYIIKKLNEVIPKQIEEQYDLYCCPNCNIYASEEIRPNYCWNCGIKFSWDLIAEKEDIKSIRKIKGIWEPGENNE